jgi:hypothetical protein
LEPKADLVSVNINISFTYLELNLVKQATEKSIFHSLQLHTTNTFIEPLSTVLEKLTLAELVMKLPALDRTCDLPACSTVPQPTTLPRASQNTLSQMNAACTQKLYFYDTSLNITFPYTWISQMVSYRQASDQNYVCIS